MDKKTAQQLIEKTFNNSFNEEQFTIFSKNLLNDFETKNNSYSGNLLWDDYKEHINSYKRIGKYIDPQGDALDILLVEVKTVTKLEKARTTLRNFVIKHLNNFEKDYALVAFYSKEDGGDDWRFSFVKLEYRSEFDEGKGKVKTKKDFTPAKRYSFLVGKYEKCHTAQEQLLPLLQNIANNPTVAELENAFSIEKVTDEFFNQYKELYSKLFEHFKKDNNIQAELLRSNIDNARFTKKLLGQIVFLYFLQKKGWLGVEQNQKWGTGNKRFVQDLFDVSENERVNFFKDKLQYLFYEALAKERDNENSYYSKLNCRIPFLNGGLFEADYDWKNANITIPTTLFRSGEEKESERTGILDVFGRYNFTIKEDEPLDKEVAVDPEMLGKVFENMLEITERKSKGAFYTPREIVHYMCQESLIHYLDNALNETKENNLLVPKTDIEDYIRKGHFALENDQRVAAKGETKTYQYQLPESIRLNAELIDQKLSDIRICDPAIGSGAFPVGLLHELVTAQLVLKPHFSLNYLKDKLDHFKFKERDNINESRYVYRLKRHIIQESIYGVDIDASAIDIARLRLWLSLVVDEDDLDPIETLPNLDYKIVCGNSLIGMPENAMHDLEIEKELENLKDKFYDQTNETTKKDLRKEINTKIRELLDSAEIYAGYKIDFDFKLFFSEVWREKGGFDVVIGNPPYIGISKVNYKDTLKKINYETFATTGDLYVLFYENGYKMLKQHGNVNLITSNKWINASYGSKTRNFFAKRTNPYLLIDFAKVKIFPNATVFVNILMLERSSPDRYVEAVAIEGNYLPTQTLYDYFTSRKVTIELKGEEVWKIGSTKELDINQKIESKGTRLKDWNGIEFFRGITSGFNEAFHLNIQDAQELISLDQKNLEIIKPLLRGKDIKRWIFDYHDLFILNSHNGVRENDVKRINVEKDYPTIYNYLLDYYDQNSPKAVLLKDGSYQTLKDRADQGDHWTNLRNCAFINEFEKPKIIWLEISERANYAFDNGGYFLTNSAYFISGENLKYLITILNSSVSDYYFFQITAKIAGGRKRYTKQYVEQIPIPVISKNDQLPFELLVDYVILSKTQTNDLIFKFFEQLLDAIVFELYFTEEMKSAGKEIINNLKDLKPINDSMSQEQKLAIIQSEFERLYDDRHPVKFAIETLDSIEEVRIIKEALK
ncbi:Eco57I restriction-modification methylase domain-containing protein [Flavobacterium phycosphaerae]|uniref:Eco57I restriction-modification methylase domain-containing protein n=1 Tax=Flavobacterium phycosphaerae TaxID=2697515 RepID=UPI00138A66BE|nr:TaqI-like C-terminal specificity domain-containing protein [Flavobacterium phycosphaerae]